MEYPYDPGEINERRPLSVPQRIKVIEEFLYVCCLHLDRLIAEDGHFDASAIHRIRVALEGICLAVDWLTDPHYDYDFCESSVSGADYRLPKREKHTPGLDRHPPEKNNETRDDE